MRNLVGVSLKSETPETQLWIVFGWYDTIAEDVGDSLYFRLERQLWWATAILDEHRDADLVRADVYE